MGANRQRSGVAAIVLAAGMSRRMGSPKQLLRLGGRTLLQRVLENVRGSRVDEIVLVLGAAAEEIRKQVATGGVSVILNPDFQQGMGTSLRTGLAAVGPQAQAVLVVLADQPFVLPSTLDQLIAVHHSEKPQIVIPMYRGFRGNPVLLERSVFPELMHLAGDVGCRAIFGSHTSGILKVAVDDPGILLDIDSAEDWKNLSAADDPAEHFRKMPDMTVRQDWIEDNPELIVVGRDAVAQALAKLARVMEFRVTVVDPLLRLEDFPDADRILHALNFSQLGNAESYVVVASRGQFDEEAIEEALRSGAAYTGLLANRKRVEEIFRSLEARGFPPEKTATVHAPAGLSIGAGNPQEVALSIMAEIVAVRRHVRIGNTN